MIMQVRSGETGDGALLARDFGFKLKLTEPTEIDRLQRTPEEGEEEEQEELQKEVGVAAEEEEEEEEEEGGEEGDEKEEEEEDFSFACANPDGSLVSAEDVFQNGQIRPIFPLFDQSLLFDDAPGDSESNKESTNDSSPALRSPLRKLFVEEKDNSSSSSSSSEQEEPEPEGPYCEWNGRKAVDASPEVCKKSNSTGFSKLWRFRERVLRSNSDGKDAFVFLNHHNLPPPPQPASTTTATGAGKKSEIKSSDEVRAEKKEKKVAVVNKGQMKKNKKPETSSLSAYLKNRKLTTEGDKRRSYLPYRQEVVGVFTNVNGLSRNVHPF